MPKYTVDVTNSVTHTYEVEAESESEAIERYSDGIVVNSEASTPFVTSVVGPVQ